MPAQITIPSPGESITEVVLGPWHKQDGEWVEKDETLVEIESDKVTLELPAPESGVLKVAAQEGEEKNVGDVIGTIDTEAEKSPREDAAGEARQEKPREAAASKHAPADAAAQNEVATATAADAAAQNARRDDGRAPRAPRASRAPGAPGDEGEPAETRATSLARKIAQERGVDLAAVRGTGPAGRITKADVLSAPLAADEAAPQRGREIVAQPAPARGTRREKMSKLRQRIAQRLVAAQHTAAMLTTFNECDMTAVMALRKKHKDAFAERHGVGLGFMSFFCRACASALQAHPRVNACIVSSGGAEIEYHDYIDISVAVGTEKGLVVPVLRNVEAMSFADIEITIKELATRARDGKLTIEEMTGGTFTISNGGVYGSLNSTPILNPPQSGILGMHKIMNRPVEDPQNPGQIALRPMMYLALSYDHRIVDGAEAVGFLVHVKECIENPERMLLGL